MEKVLACISDARSHFSSLSALPPLPVYQYYIVPSFFLFTYRHTLVPPNPLPFSPLPHTLTMPLFTPKIHFTQILFLLYLPPHWDLNSRLNFINTINLMLVDKFVLPFLMFVSVFFCNTQSTRDGYFDYWKVLRCYSLLHLQLQYNSSFKVSFCWDATEACVEPSHKALKQKWERIDYRLTLCSSPPKTQPNRRSVYKPLCTLDPWFYNTVGKI